MTEKKQSEANVALQKQKALTYLVHLLYHLCEFFVVLQNFVELGHRVSAELVGKTRHFSCGCVFLLACEPSRLLSGCDS